MPSSNVAWASLRIVLFVAACISGLIVAGIVGTNKMRDGGCILSTKMHEVDPEACEGPKCTYNNDCTPPYTCKITKVEKHCIPPSCFEARGSSETSKCKYVVGFSAGSACAALVLALVVLIRLCKSDTSVEKFSAGGLLLLTSLAWAIMCICAIAQGAVITDGFTSVCSNIDGLKKNGKVAYGCEHANKDFINPKGKPIFPDFYGEYQIAMVASWVIALAWFLLATSGIVRFCGHRRSANISHQPFENDVGTPDQADPFAKPGAAADDDDVPMDRNAFDPFGK